MPRIRTAHKFSERQRTGDVLTDELVDFSSLLLSSDVLKGLNSSGFERPSPIQLRAIPLGRCGLDLIAQAKSGTGKTCVFSVIALEGILLDSNTTQVLVLAPTREIAVQIKDVLSAIGSQMAALQCHAFIGGIHVDEDKKVLRKPCHIAVGTPGRVKFLIENHFLKTESVRLFILDEADKLLDESFQEQINWIFSSLPPNKQMMAFSATYPEYLANHLTRYMREPTFVRLNAADPTLQGLKQFYQLVPFHSLPHKTFQEKVSELLKLLSRLSFHQCLVFSNYQIRAQSLCETLCSKGWPSVFIAGSQTQAQRLKAMEKLKQFKCRVLISTDLTSRGIDAEHVNLVVNMDVPRDSETYLHRIGRAGRFGTQGIAVTFVAKGDEEKLFKTVERNIGVTIDLLPDNISQSFNKSSPSEMSNDPVLTTTQPTTSSVEVDILKRKSASQKPRINSQLESKTQSPMRNSDSEVVLDVGEKVEDTKFFNNLEEQRASVTEVENLPEQQLKLKDTQSGCGISISLRSEDMGDEPVNCELEDKCLASEHHVNDCIEQHLEDDTCSCRNSSRLPIENHSTPPKDDMLRKLQELNLGYTGSESSNYDEDPINKCCHEETCDMRNVCTRSTLEDGITNQKMPNKNAVSILYEIKSPALVLDNDDDDNDGKEMTRDSDSLDSLSGSCSPEELDSCNLLPPVGEFDRDFEEYLQSASSFLVAEENAVDYSNGFPSKEYELQGQSDSDDDVEFPEHQLHDIDSENVCHASQGVTHANHPTDHRLRDIDSESVCHASHDVTHNHTSGNSLAPGVYPQSLDAQPMPYNQQSDSEDDIEPTEHQLRDIDSTNFCHASHGVTHDHIHYATSDDSLTPGVYSQSMDSPPVPYSQYQQHGGDYCNEPFNWQQMAYVDSTYECDSSHLEPQPSWNSYPYFPATNSLHPFDDEYCSYSHYYNQADYYAGSFANDWRTCGPSAEMCSDTSFATDQHSAMPTQHEEAHVCDDNQSQQESQWIASWSNAYRRQTNCIKQFVAFNRSFRI